MKFKLMFFVKKTLNMPADIAKMSKKFSNDLQTLLKEQRADLIGQFSKMFPQIVENIPGDFEYDTEDPTQEILIKYFDKMFPFSEETPKRKRSPTASNENSDEERWIDPKKAVEISEKALGALIEKIKSDPDATVKTACLHIPNKGANKNKACGRIIEMSKENKNIYAVKCSSCGRTNTEKKIAMLQQYYTTLRQGEEAVCSPTSANCAELSGNNGRTTPDSEGTSTPADFINGKIKGLSSPSGSKPVKKKSPKIPKMQSVKQDKSNNLHDCYIIKPFTFER